jgi:AcrR family transcriptional regulator
MYAAFGNKEELFRKALVRYAEGPAAYVDSALGQPTAREVATAFLDGAVSASTNPLCPAGCMGVQGSLVSGDAARDARDALAAWREERGAHLRDRFRRAVDEGDLPRHADPALLARYLMTMADGVAVQAAGGIGRDALRQVTEAALRSWPPVRKTPLP